MTARGILGAALFVSAMFVVTPVFAAGKSKRQKPSTPSPLDQYVEEAINAGINQKPESPGSLYSPDSPIADLARDVRSRSVNDLVLIQVVEKASAISSGDLKSSRQSALKASINSVAGQKSPKGPLVNLADASMNSAINGAAATTRTTSIFTTLAARVTHVLPNGYLVLEGVKEIQVNAEKQVVVVRGVARPADLSNNTVLSDHLAQLEVRVNGKGVVGDAIRRPFILYRLLMGILPL
jgi:flagellar L-ring protein precursor FlgH